MSSISSTFRNRTSALVGFFSHSPPSTPLNFKFKGVLGVVKEEGNGEEEEEYQDKRRHVVTPVRSAREQIVDLVRQNLKTIPVVRFQEEKRNELCIDFCVICMENFKEKDKLRVLQCQHTYHKKCIDTWLLRSSAPSCPLCKRNALGIRACEGCSRHDCKSCGVGTWVYCKIGASLLSS